MPEDENPKSPPAPPLDARVRELLEPLRAIARGDAAADARAALALCDAVELIAGACMGTGRAFDQVIEIVGRIEQRTIAATSPEAIEDFHRAAAAKLALRNVKALAKRMRHKSKAAGGLTDQQVGAYAAHFLRFCAEGGEPESEADILREGDDGEQRG